MKNNNDGSSVLVALLLLGLLVVITTSISNIYVNKIKSINNISTYYDKKIKEQLRKNKLH